MLTKEPEMLQPDAFCGPCWGSVQRSPDSLAGFKGATSRWDGEGKGRKGNGGKEKGGDGRVGWEGKGRRGTGREGKRRGRGEEGRLTQLEQGRRLAKAGPASRRRSYTGGRHVSRLTGIPRCAPHLPRRPLRRAMICMLLSVYEESVL